MTSTVINGNVLDILKVFPDETFHEIITSIPYYGLRNYGTDPVVWGAKDGCEHEWGDDIKGDPRGGSGTPTNKNNRGEGYARGSGKGNFCKKCGAWKGELGQEPTPELYVKHITDIFREARRVLRNDGVLWLNVGDSYAGSGKGPSNSRSRPCQCMSDPILNGGAAPTSWMKVPSGCKPKDLIGIPWMIAFSLRADGWYLRSDIPWLKRNSMPSSVKDRPGSSIEHIFLLAKSTHYFYDHIATMQPSSESYNKDKRPRGVIRQCVNPSSKYPDEGQFKKQDHAGNNTYTGFNDRYEPNGFGLRYMRDSDFFFRTWQGLLHNEDGEPMALVVNPKGYKGAHFACVDTETECLTISGWKRHDQIRIGDDIFTYNMKTGKLEIQPLQGIVSYRYSGNLVSVFGRSSNMLMTPNHRCVVTTRDKKVKGGRHPAKIVEAANLKGGMKFPVASTLDFVPHGSFYRPEFYELLGWVLSEGYYKDTGCVGINQSFSANPSKCTRITHLLEDLGMPYSMSTHERIYKGKPSIEQEWHVTGWARAKIRQTLPDKYRIPENFLLLPDDCIDAFLSGFVGGDGSVRCDGRICITQKEKQPLDIIQAMFLRRGKSCILSQRGGGMWSAFITNAKDRCFKDSRESLVDMDYPYDGTVWCPTVQNGTWVARRGGRPFITGNCFPVKLAEALVLAGTSEKGVCPHCGAPWVRQTKKGEFQNQSWGGEHVKLQDAVGGVGSTSCLKSGGTYAIETTGWTPSCSCEDNIPVPATVLDPFNGSGATGVACQWHNRDYVGIDINPAYCSLSEKRLKENK